MTLSEIIRDIHALEEDITAYERKYGVLTETFYESYINGEEPPDESWVLDWNDWAGAYEILLQRRTQYQELISLLRKRYLPSIAEIISRTARREPLPLPA